MTKSSSHSVIILAAGQGTRMKSKLPKVLHEICRKPILQRVIEVARATNPAEIVVVVRFERELIEAWLSLNAPDVRVAVQGEIPGTGSGARAGVDALRHLGVAGGQVVILSGDSPLILPSTIESLISHAAEGGSGSSQKQLTLLTSELDDPTGYGRVLRGDDGAVERIVEQKDANPAEVLVKEVNSGIYCVDFEFLADALGRLDTDNAQGEMYLTDIVALASSKGAYKHHDSSELEGINDRVQLSNLSRVLNRRIIAAYQREGVTVEDPDSTWIADDCLIEPDVTIMPGTYIVDGVTIRSGAVVGPHAYLRSGTVVGPDAKIGAFVETKNLSLGEGSKIPHLIYAGDATIGSDTNIGCGSIFANYDGVNKNHTSVGDGVRLGSNTILVAPVNVGDGVFTGAGSVVREDIPANSLAYSENSLTIKEGATEGRLEKLRAEKAERERTNAADTK